VLAVDGLDPNATLNQRGPRIRVVEGQNFGDELVLAEQNQEYVIGRSPKANLVLEDREVSREHIKVVRRGNAVFVFDSASTRGSWLGRSAVYQGSRVEWELPRMLKLGATVLSLDLPPEARQAAGAVQVSAPMTAPPRVRSERPQPQQAPEVGPDAQAADPIVAFHYGAAPTASAETQGPDPSAAVQPSIPPPHQPNTSRRAWKKTGPTFGRTSGLLLLAFAGIAILGVLFVVFSLME
jgi:predicted component of type VI protein secretion system